MDFAKKDKATIFQSTLPAGEATAPIQRYCPDLPISIHASRGGSDLRFRQHAYGRQYFNPRFPRGKRLTANYKALGKERISIHASRGGSDS